MGLRSFFVYTLCYCLALGPTSLYAAQDQADRNIRLRDRTPGLYLTPKIDAAHPEAENFSTTHQPVAPLTLEGIEDFIRQHPEVAGYKLAIIGPAVRGTEAEIFRTRTEEVLRMAGITPDVQVIRHPKTLREKILNLIPRREDYEKPTTGELSVAAGKILIAESLTFTVLLVPAVLQLNDIQINAMIDSIVDQIALPLGVGVAMSVLDVANMIPLVSFRRALSNHNIRLSTGEKFLRMLIMSAFFSFNFYAVSQSPQLIEYASQATLAAIPQDLLTGLGKAAAVVIPASVFNTLSRTTVASSLNVWEQGSQNRRFYTSILEAVTNILIAPIYILSTMPVLSPLVHVPLMDINAAHLTMLGIGGLGAGAWISLEKEKLANWIVKTKDACVARLTKMGEWFLTGQKRD